MASRALFVASGSGLHRVEVPVQRTYRLIKERNKGAPIAKAVELSFLSRLKRSKAMLPHAANFTLTRACARHRQPM